MGIIYSRLFSSLYFLFLIVFTSTLANADENNVNKQNFHYFCDFNHIAGNYAPNSTYATNLNTLLSKLTSNTEITYGFYNFSQGQNPNKINAIGLCRGDINPNECHNCLTSSKSNLTQLCPNQKEAIGWYDDEKCILRYSNRLIFNLNEDGPAYFVWNKNNATNEDAFNKVVKNLLDSLRSRAILGDSRVKFAAAASEVRTDNQTVYGLVQCTPDLSREQCDDCLVKSIAEIPHCCDNRVGARIIRPSCSVRYETNSLFYEPLAVASPSPSPLALPLAPPPSFGQNTSSEDKGKTSKTTVSVVTLLLFLLYSFLSVCF